MLCVTLWKAMMWMSRWLLTSIIFCSKKFRQIAYTAPHGNNSATEFYSNTQKVWFWLLYKVIFSKRNPCVERPWGEKGRFSTKTKSSGIQGEGVAPWPQGQKNLNGWQSYRRNDELRITSKKYSNENTHQVFWSFFIFFANIPQLRFGQVWSLTQIYSVGF